MRLHILSDLHLSVHPLALAPSTADLIVLAGDIDRPAAAMAWAQALGKPVIYVPGNHEFYGSDLESTTAELRALAAGSCVQVLHNQAWEWGGVRFLGSTLWSDFRAAGDGAAQAQAMAQSLAFNRDFSRIRLHPGDGAARLTPQHCAQLFAANARWLDAALATPFAGPTVVITHHAPTLGSVHPRFAGSPLNVNFVSDAAWLLGGERTALWIHGHTHDSFDYDMQGTRVLCNPRGYAKDGVPENPLFDPGLIVDIPLAR
ncbi:metallophosphoesterase [Acidovorax sp. HDW3]|uniref:metallophosphoesterase family protein n=1 Tax=Acidovorax sp. HDW3 TaxID=2714923 RepID=UPI00140E03CA|nr:metallophosphoesterase family protein [Acidovorax sp. HDW3]QIL44685.1 metallophosphoesterase [Acidovorax sp. HDW3]